MTNLIEKSLLIGFGIFSLIVFLFTIVPPYYETLKYKEKSEDEEDSLKEINEFIQEFNQILNNVLSEHNFPYSTKIRYPNNLNIEFKEKQIKYELHFTEDTYFKIYVYNVSFVGKYYSNLIPNDYLLNITMASQKLNVEFLNIF